MVMVDVDSGLYEAASRVFGQTIAPGVERIYTQLTSSLYGTAGMAGSDQAGTSWASSYDPAVEQTGPVIASLEAASYKIAGLLEQTGFNHDIAEADSDQTGRAPGPPDRTTYTANTVTAAGTCSSTGLPIPPAASTESSGGPPGWSVLVHAVGFLWPNGDTGKLRNAASAWNTAASGLDSLSYCVPEAVDGIRAQQSPEVADAVAVCTSMQSNLCNTAEVCRTLGSACSQLASHIDTAHAEMESELRSFVEWTAGIEAAGALFSVVSFGASEGAAQIAEGGRFAETAAKLAEFCKTLVGLAETVGDTIEQVTTKIAGIGSELRAILGARLVAVVANVVDRFPFLARATEDAEEGLATEAKYQGYVRRLEAEGKTPKSFEGWKNLTESAARNKEAGAAYEAQVMREEGLTKGVDGWDTHVTFRSSTGNRFFDIANEGKQEAIETKSGNSPPGKTFIQMDKDEEAVRQGWTIKWVLKKDMQPQLMQRLQELHAKYGSSFTYEVRG